MTKKCPNCGRNVASDAEFCPGCGKKKPNDATTGQKVGCFIAIIVLILAGLNSLCSKCSPGSAPQQQQATQSSNSVQTQSSGGTELPDPEQPFDSINTVRPEIVSTVGNTSRNRLLQNSDLSQLSYREIKLIRNYIYACYDRPFNVDWIRTYFLQHMDGYQGNGLSNPELTEIESNNIVFIQEYERSNNIPVINN